MPERENGFEDAGTAVLSALKSRELLVPAALGAAGVVAATKAPDLLHRIGDAGERKGREQAEQFGERAVEGAKHGLQNGPGGVAGKALGKMLPGGGGGGGGAKKTRRLPIQRWTDVAVAPAKAYEMWTDFEDYPKFMHRVLSVQEENQSKVKWNEKIWFSKRQWEGEITDRRKNDRIAWKTTSGMSHRGLVSFHEIAPNLTRVMVTMEFEPTGMIEKMASGLRFVKRAVQADLARFKAYVEMEDAKGIEYRSQDQRKREENRRERAESRNNRRASARNS
jgi:ribosome-associated toxin RatA of RatAB toxin-antitoxin module